MDAVQKLEPCRGHACVTIVQKGRPRNRYVRSKPLSRGHLHCLIYFTTGRLAPRQTHLAAPIPDRARPDRE